MSAQENIKLDEEVSAAWNAHDVDRALGPMSDDIVWHDVGSPEPFKGKEAVRQYLQGWFTAFPDSKFTVKNRVVTEDQLAAEMEFTGTHKGPLQFDPNGPAIPATGKTINGKGSYFVRFKNGKAVEVRSYPDVAGMMMQLGLMPSPEEMNK